MSVYDQQVDLTSPNEFAEIVAERAPDLVGMTSYTPGIANAFRWLGQSRHGFPTSRS